MRWVSRWLTPEKKKRSVSRKQETKSMISNILLCDACICVGLRSMYRVGDRQVKLASFLPGINQWSSVCMTPCRRVVSVSRWIIGWCPSIRSVVDLCLRRDEDQEYHETELERKRHSNDRCELCSSMENITYEKYFWHFFSWIRSVLLDASFFFWSELKQCPPSTRFPFFIYSLYVCDGTQSPLSPVVDPTLRQNPSTRKSSTLSRGSHI